MTGLEHVRFADEELIKTQVLQGEAAQTIIRGENCSVYKMENETGEGVITRYPVFPGIELLYDDIHMSCGVAHREDPRADLLEINHCRTGRFECEFSDGRAVYLGEGDLAVKVMTNRTRETWFPVPLPRHHHRSGYSGGRQGAASGVGGAGRRAVLRPFCHAGPAVCPQLLLRYAGG